MPENILTSPLCLVSIFYHPTIDVICGKLTPDTVRLVPMVSKSTTGTRGSHLSIEDSIVQRIPAGKGGKLFADTMT